MFSKTGWAIAAILLLAAALAGPSCSSDAPKAKALLEQADKEARSLADKLLELNDDVETLCADLTAGFNTEPFGVAAKTADFKRRIQAIAKSSTSLRAEYARVGKLKVPGEYSKYVSVLLSTIEQVSAIEKVLAETVHNIEATQDSEFGPDKGLLERSKRTLEGIDEQVRYYKQQATELRKKIGL